MITILMPTLNRPEFVARALNYYAATGFTGVVMIGDSSDNEPRTQNEAAVAAVRDRVKTVYAHLPREQFANKGMCLQALGERVDTPFVIYAGDADFVVPHTLDRA